MSVRGNARPALRRTESVPRRATIVMYHFVRDLVNTRYKGIKGLDVRDFAGQIDYIAKHYNVVRMEDLIAAVSDPAHQLPERALLLTFDDGYADHFQTVFPLLDSFGWQGSFFPPARAILERRVLDVNKIHFMLSEAKDLAEVVRAMEECVESRRCDYDLKPLPWYREQLAHANRWDPAEVIYIKRMLQHGLPEELRASIVDGLFREFVTTDETALANELYVSVEQLRTMHRHGMHIGSHSYDHYWLDTLDPPTQEVQIHKSLEFLTALGCDDQNWTICYPYGAYDASLIETAARLGCRLGLTTNVAIANIDSPNSFELARIDTNDLPRYGLAPVVEWTKRA